MRVPWSLTCSGAHRGEADRVPFLRLQPRRRAIDAVVLSVGPWLCPGRRSPVRQEAGSVVVVVVQRWRAAWRLMPRRLAISVLLKVYAGCIDGEEELVNKRIEQALRASRTHGQAKAVRGSP